MSAISLPLVSEDVASKLAAWFAGREPMMLRPPEVTAKLMAFVVLAHQERLPFPTRPEVAKHLGLSVPQVDVVLAKRRATKDIRIVSRLMKGNVQQGISTIKFRTVIPTNQEMIKVVLDAAAGG
jgi:hypothetical protein